MKERRMTYRPPPRIRVGDRVFVQGMPVLALEVIDASDPSIITLKSEHGVTLKVGRMTVIPARNAASDFHQQHER